MLVKSIIDEDFSNYKFPSMFIGTCFCDFKCCKRAGISISACQNSELAKQPNIEISNEEIYQRYINNPLTKAIVIGGLEPFEQTDDIISLIGYFRKHGCQDKFVIYTGFELSDIKDKLDQLKKYSGIILKTGRYIPNHSLHYDEILGVNLISDNQKGIVLC